MMSRDPGAHEEELDWRRSFAHTGLMQSSVVYAQFNSQQCLD